MVRLVVASVRGSAPREAGATLLFWNEADGKIRIQGSVGGGHLEARAMEIAGHLLGDSAEARKVERFSLGASLGQCCGGAVELYWERFDSLEQTALLSSADWTSGCLRYCALDGSGREWTVPVFHGYGAFSGRAGLVEVDGVRCFVERLEDDATPLWLYGAGHVGRALTTVLADLPFRLIWVDSRRDVLEEAVALNPRRNLASIHVETPEEAAASAPRKAWHLVMTHSHDEDFRICETLLRKDDFDFLGVIGSQTKEARFRHRLLQKGCAPTAVARMACPIGIDGIQSKLPAAIAISVAAQLLQMREASALGTTSHHINHHPAEGAVR